MKPYCDRAYGRSAGMEMPAALQTRGLAGILAHRINIFSRPPRRHECRFVGGTLPASRPYALAREAVAGSAADSEAGRSPPSRPHGLTGSAYVSARCAR